MAVDVAMTAIRHGAESVNIVCLESEQEIPASPWEIKTAEAEGIKIIPSWSPIEIIGKDGKVVGLDLVKCTRVFDGDGNFNPQCDLDTKKSMITDQVIMAIGQEADLSILSDTDISVEKGTIFVDPDTLKTTLENIYSAGDVASHISGSVISSIASGRKVAESIDLALGGTGVIDETLVDKISNNGNIGIDHDFAYLSREKEREVDSKKRCNNFEEITFSYNNKQAIQEASRCLQCDLRLDLNNNSFPPSKKLFVLNKEEIDTMTPNDTEGVYKLLDANKNVISIVGTSTLRTDLIHAFENKSKVASFFEFEEDKMYSKRESELIQEHLQKYGEMPGGDDDMDDLF